MSFVNSCLITLALTYDTILHRSGDGENPCLFPELAIDLIPVTFITLKYVHSIAN
jgi:hypothetical protein